MGLNHIDARLGGQCNYGVLDPLFGAHPPDPGSGVWDPRSGIPWDLGSQGIGIILVGDTVKPGYGVWGQAPNPIPRFHRISNEDVLSCCTGTAAAQQLLGLCSSYAAASHGLQRPRLQPTILRG